MTFQEAEGQLLRLVGLQRYCLGFIWDSLPYRFPKFPWSNYEAPVGKILP